MDSTFAHSCDPLHREVALLVEVMHDYREKNRALHDSLKRDRGPLG